MKTYELIIERQQPPCGGKPAKVVAQTHEHIGLTPRFDRGHV